VPAQIRASSLEHPNVGKATPWILLEAAQDDGIEPTAHVAPDAPNRGRGRIQNLGAHLGDALTVERMLARQELVQEHAERPDVGASVDVRRVQHLFGRHVPRGTEALRRIRERATAFVRETLGDAEIEDFQDRVTVVATRQEEVRRLDVAVDERQRVRFGEPLARFEHEPNGLGRSERTDSSEKRFEPDAFEPFHDEVRFAALERAHVVHPRDVLSLEERCRTRFVHETHHEFRVALEVRANDLQRHLRFESQVGRLEHDPHTAFADELADSITAADEVTGSDG
jgi:hypothetical protein